MPLGKEIGVGPGHIVLDGDPVGTQRLATFRPMSVVAKRSPISATAELLFCLQMPKSTISNRWLVRDKEIYAGIC